MVRLEQFHIVGENTNFRARRLWRRATISILPARPSQSPTYSNVELELHILGQVDLR
jgi:hypothetical protein